MIMTMEHQKQQEKKDNVSKFKELNNSGSGIPHHSTLPPQQPQQQQQQQQQQQIQPSYQQHHQRQGSAGGHSPPNYHVLDLPSKERFKELLYRIEKEYEILWEENQELKLKYGLINKTSPAPQLLISHMGMITNPPPPQPPTNHHPQLQIQQPPQPIQQQPQQQQQKQSSSSSKKQSGKQNESIYYEIFNNLGSGKTKISSKSKEKEKEKEKDKDKEKKQKSNNTQSSKSSRVNNPSKRDGSHKWIRAREYLGHRDGIWDICASPWDLFQFATASFDRTARIWTVDGSKIPLVYTAHTGTVNSIRYHPNERFLCTASGDKTIHVIKLPNERNSHSGVKSPLPFHSKHNHNHHHHHHHHQQQQQQQQHYQQPQQQHYQQHYQHQPQYQPQYQQQQQQQQYQLNQKSFQQQQQPQQHQVYQTISPQQPTSPIRNRNNNTFLDDNSDIDSISSVNGNDFEEYQPPPQETGEKLKLWTPLLEKGTPPPPQVIVDNRHSRHPSLNVDQQHFEMENMDSGINQTYTPQSPTSIHGDDFKVESTFSNPIVNTYNNNNNVINNSSNNLKNPNPNPINNSNNNNNKSKTTTTTTSNYVGASTPEPAYITIRTPFLELKGHSGPVVAANWISSTVIFSSSWDNTVRWWSTETSKLITQVSVFPRADKHRYKMTNVTSNPNSSTNSLTSSTDGVVRIWDFRTPTNSIDSINSSQDSINSAIYTHDGTNIVTAGEDKTIRVYDIRQSKDCKTSIRCPHSINRISVNGKACIAIPQDDGRVSVYNIYGNRKGKMRDQYKYGHKCMATATTWSSDDSVIISSSFDRKAISWASSSE